MSQVAEYGFSTAARKVRQLNRYYHFLQCWGMNSFLKYDSHLFPFYSVADPDPYDPYVFGPPESGSGSISQRYGSGSF
jgi:hypothetical protein